MKKTVAVLLAIILMLEIIPKANADAGNGIPTVYITGELAPFENKSIYTGCTIVIEDESGAVLLSDERAQWRRHGNSTSHEDKCPYKLKLSSNENILGMGSADSWILLANAYDTTLLRNKLAFDLANNMGMEFTSESRFVDVYVNGDYRGNYLLVEPVEIDDKRVDIHPANNEFLLEINRVRWFDGPGIRTSEKKYTFELNSIDYLPNSQRIWLESFMNQVEQAFISCDEDKIATIINIDSFVDLFLIHTLLMNYDVSGASVRFYIKDGVLYAGPIWDFDLAMGNYKENIRPDKYWFTPFYLYFEDLSKCDWFCRRFAERYIELQPIIVNMYADNELGKNRIDYLIYSMRDSIDMNFNRWEITEVLYRIPRIPDATYEENVEFLRNWLEIRNKWILQNLEDIPYNKE